MNYGLHDFLKGLGEIMEGLYYCDLSIAYVGAFFIMVMNMFNTIYDLRKLFNRSNTLLICFSLQDDDM